jgi:hypothetical protein
VSKGKHKTKTPRTKFRPATGGKPERDLLRWQHAIFVSQMPEVRALAGPVDDELQRLIVDKLKEAGLVAETTKALDVNVVRLVQMARLLLPS